LLWLVAGCTAIRPLDPIDLDAAGRDAASRDAAIADAGLDASEVDAGTDAGHDAASVDAWALDAWEGDANCPPEVCGGGDEDCDGTVDESGAMGATTYFMDGDHDGYGTDASAMTLCTPPLAGTWVPRGGDCDDTSSMVRPGRSDSSCNGIDDDCDGVIDDGATSCGVLCQVRHDRGHSYLFCVQVRSQTEAADQCMALGYHLVDIDDMAENDFVQSNATGGVGGSYVWIGAQEVPAGSHTFVSTTGDPVPYFDWDVSEPNGSGPCVRMRTTNGTWADNPCGQSYSYVCEAP
jgi:hypothetical protein